MKNNLLKNVKWYLLSVALCSALFMYAGAGFHDQDAVKVKFTVNGSDQEKSLNLYNQGDYDLGTVSSLKLASIYATIWKNKNDNGNCCGVRMHYVIYTQGSRVTNFVTTDYAGHKDDWEEGDAIHQHWGKDDYNIDLLSGLGNGNYVMECYFTAKGSTNSNNCDENAFSANNNDGKNYIFKFKKEGGSTVCDLQSGTGGNLAANTTVFFDNSMINFDNVFVSVVADENKNITPVMAKSGYKPKSDKFYPMTCGENNIWKATITDASSNAKLCFWNKDIHDYNDLNDCSVAYLVLYNKDKNLYKPKDNVCEQQNNLKFYTKGTWDVVKMLEFESSVSSYSLDEIPAKIVLTANSYGIKGTKYTFEYRAFDEADYKPLATQNSPILELTGGNIPLKSTYYRVSYGDGSDKETSERIRISVIQNCNSGKIVYENTFEKVNNVDKLFASLTERRSDPNMTSDYTFQDYPGLIDDGDYAVVATPRYCGCGIGSAQNCVQCHNVHHCKCYYDENQRKFIDGEECDIDRCDGANPWFRDIKDNTYKGEGGKYGGMLFINFKNGKSNIAYSHELTSEEKKLFVAGSTLNFSAYFANATKDNSSTSQPINMDLVIEYKAVGSSKWEEQTKVTSKVTYNEGWKQCSASIDLESSDGDYRIVVKNHGGTGVGNDVLIDDITLRLCVPTFPVSFYDEETDSEYDTYTYTQIDETQIIRIAKQDYGHGENNCVVLLSVDDSKKAGEAGRYKVIDVMDKASYKGSDYYSTTKSVNELLGGNVGTGKLQALVTKPEICSDPAKFENLKSKLANGEIKPLDSDDYMFSTNMLTYGISCDNSMSALFDITQVCEKKRPSDLPALTVKSGFISSYVYYSISEGATVIVGDVALSADEIASGEFTVDFNNLDQTKIIRTPGTHTYTVSMYEYSRMQTATYVPSKLCEKSKSVSLTVVDCDNVSLTLSPAAKSICKGEEFEFTASLTNLGSIPANVSVTEDIAGMNNFEPISATPSQGTFSGNVWTITGFAQGASATLVLKYKAKIDAEVGGTEKVYVSRLGESIWGSYDRQTDENMKASSVISAKEVTDSPILSDPYDECQKPGFKALSDFVTSEKTELHWYSDAELKNEVIPAQFDMNVPTPAPTPTTRGTVYYVTNQETGKCVSVYSVQPVMVRKSPAQVVTKNFKECTADKKLDLQTLVTNYDSQNTYTYYYDGSPLNDKVVDLESGDAKTYSVQAMLGDCMSDMANMTVSVKVPVISVLLKEKDGVEYDLDGVPTVKRNLGMSTEKVLTITPTDAPNYSLKWYLGDAAFDGSFPRKPYLDQVYKVVVVDECGNTHIATAGTQVEWPTIFMPYDNSANKDFVVGIDGGIELFVFDRSGNMVAHTADGWDGFANQNGNTKIAMPGLYYYKAILPDGSVKKGTVEVFKK